MALDRPDIDTDLLVPTQFLTRIDRTGYGQFLLHDLRLRPDGSPDPGFILNQPAAKGAAILLAPGSFGIGSSREHAVWALDGWGFRVVISTGFGDIFYNNALGDGLLLVKLPEADFGPLLSSVLARQGLELTVDLRELSITGPDGAKIPFEMEASRRERHLGGLDAIGLTLQRAAAIEAYEREHNQPWQAAGPRKSLA